MLPFDLKQYHHNRSGTGYEKLGTTADKVCFLLTGVVTTTLFIALIALLALASVTIQEMESFNTAVQGVQK